jgi:uncharacterized UBP type Zn finger protein
MSEPCEHASGIRKVAPAADGCEDCLAIGAKWTELRLCLTCGHVGCCEDSPNAHALAHFNATGHPLIASWERGQNWAWCYAHRIYFDPPPGTVAKRRSSLATLVGRLVGR